jgi:hypothetical protein
MQDFLRSSEFQKLVGLIVLLGIVSWGIMFLLAIEKFFGRSKKIVPERPSYLPNSTTNYPPE